MDRPHFGQPFLGCVVKFMKILFADVLGNGNFGNSTGLIHGLFLVLIIGICVAIIWGVGRWIITKITAAPTVMAVWNGFFILVGAIVVVNFLMSLVGHGFMAY